MPQIKYLAYIAIICAVLLNLYSGKPDVTPAVQLALDAAALVCALLGLGGFALGGRRISRRS